MEEMHAAQTYTIKIKYIVHHKYLYVEYRKKHKIKKRQKCDVRLLKRKETRARGFCDAKIQAVNQ